MTWEELKIGMDFLVQPLNKKFQPQIAKLQYEQGFKGKGMYNLNPYWYVRLRLFGNHYTTIIIKNLEQLTEI